MSPDVTFLPCSMTWVPTIVTALVMGLCSHHRGCV